MQSKFSRITCLKRTTPLRTMLFTTIITMLPATSFAAGTLLALQIYILILIVSAIFTDTIALKIFFENIKLGELFGTSLVKNVISGVILFTIPLKMPSIFSINDKFLWLAALALIVITDYCYLRYSNMKGNFQRVSIIKCIFLNTVSKMFLAVLFYIIIFIYF